MKTQLTFPKKKSGLIAILVIALLALNPMHAQTKNTTSEPISNQELTVSGTVSDETGPLLGAAITLKGSNVGTISDEEGMFTFPKALKPNDILIISFLGYENKEIKIKKDTSFIKVVLDSDLVEMLGAVDTNKPYKTKRKSRN